VEQVDELCVGKDTPAQKAIEKMAIREVKPQEEDDEDCKMIEEPTSTSPAADPRVSPDKNLESPGLPETPEKIPETPGMLLVIPKVVKKMRN
jgi:hypothetical protein